MNAIDRAARTDSNSIDTCRLKLSLAGLRRGPQRLAQAGVLAAVTLAGLASVGCSSVNAASPPVVPASTSAAVCHATSAAKVLARRVFVPGGVQATEQDGAFSVRFAPDHSHCVAVDWPSTELRTVPGSCDAAADRTAVRENNAGETMLAWDSRDAFALHPGLGIGTQDTPHAFVGFGIAGDRRTVERPFRVLSSLGHGADAATQFAPIGHDRFLVAWVDGDSESHQLRAQSVVGWGDPVGPSMVLSPAEASVIGRPSVAVAPTGYGIVTYVASIEGEFDILATPVACAMN
jgi:hypothetical protein